MLTNIEQISKTYQNGKTEPLRALEEIRLDIGTNEFVCMVGPSGCGKSTLLSIVAGLLEPSSGRVTFQDVAPGKPPTGMVFQDLGLFPWRTVGGNVGYGLEELGVPKRERKSRIKELLNMVGLEGFENRFPHELSGGMRQRTALARALAPEPALLLMDEPLSSLDAQTRQDMQTELSRLFERGERSFLYVTHDVGEAVFLGDRVVVLSPRPGRVLEILQVELPRPRGQGLRREASFNSLVNQVEALLRGGLQ